MRGGVHRGWRLVSAVAFGGTAVLAVMVSRGGPGSAVLVPASASSPASAAGTQQPLTAVCATSALRVSVGPGSRITLAVTRYPLEFTNVSGAACTLTGYPQVAAFRGRDVQVGEEAGRDPSAEAARVLLAPGQTAHAALDASLPAARCRPVRAAGLRVAVTPGASAFRYVRRPLTACAAGHQDYLRVHAIAAGTGTA
jgi:hypothetical protein